LLLDAVVKQKTQYDRRERRHSGLDYQPPLAFSKNLDNCHSQPKWVLRNDGVTSNHL